ncbi:MAG: tetratricopeptide (TPR) repeat protein [Pirellulaceae bacterium]|jgi:tetratricopeptide (TPR) repeat protein
MVMKKVLGLVAVLCLFTAPAVRAQTVDQVFGAGGLPTRGVIESVSSTEVVIKSNNVARKFPVNEILKITFADDPTDLRTARDRIRGGQIEDAARLLAQIDVTKVGRNVVKQDVVYYLAFCQGKAALNSAKDSDKLDAEKKMREFYTVHAGTKSYHYFEGMKLLGDLAASMGNFDDAANYYKKFGEAPWAKSEGDLLVAGSMLKAAQYTDALDKFKEVLADADGSPASEGRRLESLVGIAFCNAMSGKHTQAIEELQDIIKKNDPTNTILFARAYNALGAAHTAGNAPKDAVIAYLFTDLLFYGDSDAHAEALYHLTSLWAKVNKPTRAREAREKLLGRYGGSPWAAKLRES